MNCLAIDTTTQQCSVALSIGDSVIDIEQPMVKGHSEQVLPMVDTLLQQADIPLSALDVLAVDHGPGSFTGIRVGVGVAQGLAFAVDLPVICVSSLAVLAQGSAESACICAIDARMHQVYFAAFQHGASGAMTVIDTIAVASPADASTVIRGVLDKSDRPIGDWTAVGSGFSAYEDLCDEYPATAWKRIDATALPQARHALALAEQEWRSKNVCQAQDVLPLYVRNQVVHQSAANNN